MPENSSISLLRQMREIVRAKKESDSAPTHPHQRGVESLQTGDFAGAIEFLNEAIRQNPDFSFSHHFLGEALFHLGEGASAETAVRRAIELNPHYAASFALLGDLRMQNEDWTTAIEFYRQSLALAPDNAPALRGLAVCLMRQADTNSDEARSLLKKAYELQPNETKTLALLLEIAPLDVELCRAVAENAHAARDYPQAIYFYRLAARQSSTNVLLWLKLASCLQMNGDIEQASEILRQVADLECEDAEAWHLRGEILTAQNRSTDALAAYRRAVALCPTNARWHKTIGDLYARQNQIDEARRSYERALALGYQIY